jgi:hypothetical protein
MTKGFNSLPNWAKGTIAVIGVATIVYAGWLVKKGIDKLIAGRDERKEDEAQKDELEKLEDAGIKPTLSDSMAYGLSNTIKTLLDGCESSGSELEVMEQILASVNNQADWVKLQKVFGKKSIDNCGWGTGDTEYDLRSLLTDQLDGFDWSFTMYIDVLKEGLQAKGITF